MNSNGTNMWDISQTHNDVYTNDTLSTIYVSDNTGSGSLTSNKSYAFHNDINITTIDIPSTLSVKGDAVFEGSLKLGGKDIGEALAKIESRLAILYSRPELEARWDNLKKLGEQYRQLESEILEQEKIYQILST